MWRAMRLVQQPWSRHFSAFADTHRSTAASSPPSGPCTRSMLRVVGPPLQRERRKRRAYSASLATQICVGAVWMSLPPCSPPPPTDAALPLLPLTLQAQHMVVDMIALGVSASAMYLAKNMKVRLPPRQWALCCTEVWLPLTCRLCVT